MRGIHVLHKMVGPPAGPGVPVPPPGVLGPPGEL